MKEQSYIAKESKTCIKTQRRNENNPHATHKKESVQYKHKAA